MTAAITSAIELLRWEHNAHECDCPAVCGTCRTVAGLRRALDTLAKPATNRDHARLHGGMFDARRACAVRE